MPTARVELSIEIGSDPIQGSLLAANRAPQPFCGWIELTGAIEAERVAQPFQQDRSVREASD